MQKGNQTQVDLFYSVVMHHRQEHRFLTQFHEEAILVGVFGLFCLGKSSQQSDGPPLSITADETCSASPNSGTRSVDRGETGLVESRLRYPDNEHRWSSRVGSGWGEEAVSM